MLLEVIVFNMFILCKINSFYFISIYDWFDS
jgi:hypothetical protein